MNYSMKLLRVLVFLVCFLGTIPQKAAAQYSFLLHKPYRDKVEIIDTFYARIVAITDTAVALKEIKNLEKFGRDNKDRELELEGELLKAYYYVTLTQKNRQVNEATLQKLQVIAAKGKKENYLHIEARAIRVMAEYYWRWLGNYELAFENYLNLNDIISKTNEHDFPNLAEYYYLIGEPYFVFKDYENTMAFMHKTLAIAETPFNWKAIWSANNTLGLCYQRLKNIDSSNYYFTKALQSSFIKKGSIWHSIVQGNVAQNLYAQKKYAQALPLIEYDYTNAVLHNEYNLAANAAMLLADIYTIKKNIAAGNNWLNNAIVNIKKAERPYEMLPQYYSVKSSWHSLTLNIDKAKLYLDSAIIARDILNEKVNAIYVLRAEQKAYKNKIQTEQKNLALAKKNKNIQLGAALIIIFILLIFTAVIYTIQRKRRLAEAQANKVRLTYAQRQLQNAEVQLSNFKKDTAEKNKMLETLSVNEDANRHIIEALRRTAILTNDDWENFREAFEKVHTGFINQLKLKVKDITPSEIRMIVLARLNLSKKEMANALGISPQSLRVTWHRLRKKITVNDDLQMEAFAQTI